MPVTLHCVRHAQGYHNLSEENEEKFHDPDLTQRGKEQCERLRDRFPHQSQVDCVIASPIRRTIQTALIGFEPAITQNKLKIILAPRAQETSDKPSDTGSDLEKLKSEFKGKLDERRMEEGWNTNEGEWKMDALNIEKHVVELRREVQTKAEEMGLEHVVLVAHGGFLHYFTEDWSDNPGKEGSTGWVNTEFRSYEFVAGNGAHLKETEESRRRREHVPAGGFETENGLAHENPSGSGAQS